MGLLFYMHQVFIGTIVAAIGNLGEFFENAFRATIALTAFVLRIAWSPFAAISKGAVAVYRLAQDSVICLDVIHAMRSGKYDAYRAESMIHYRHKTFPNSRAYRALMRCCKNEQAKRRRRILRELSAIDDEHIDLMHDKTSDGG